MRSEAPASVSAGVRRRVVRDSPRSPIGDLGTILGRVRGGNKRHVDEREVMSGIMYVLSTGCLWRAIPKDLPPQHGARLSRLVELRRHARSLTLYVECRERGKREASPPLPSSIAKASRALKKGPCIDPHG